MRRSADTGNARNRPGPVARSAAWFAATLEEEADRWFLWLPVLFGTGIGLYFAFDHEPGALTVIGVVAATASLCVMALKTRLVWVFSAAALVVALGFADAKLRTALVAQPALEKTRTLTVRGWVERTEAQLPRGARITLRVYEVPRVDGAFPTRVRVVSRFDQVPETGTAVEVRARLNPVPDPVMPGGFDFARKAYYAGLGAVGFAFTPPKTLHTSPEPPVLLRIKSAIDRLRHAVEGRITSAVPGQTGAVAAALVTGERGRIPKDVLQSLRDSGLAHMLAISGLHMALMAGALYFLVRACAAAFPAIALRYPIKKWAAVVALIGAAFYLALSGASIATQRAFLMAAIVFTAILIDRPALTLRNVAVAAMIILIAFPESLLDVSFQMSFAAVTALVAVYERVERTGWSAPPATRLQWALRKSFWYLVGIAFTTLVASVAVAPFAAFHFHKLAQYSLLANLATMPVFGLIVMPAALFVLILMPFGLEALPLHVMTWGIDHVLDIAASVSRWDGATIEVATMPLLSLLALVAGGLWLCLWRGTWRLAGLAIATIGLLTLGNLPRPDILIGREGKIVAVRTDADRFAFSGGTRNSYSLTQWLKADGDPRDPGAVLKKGGFRCDELACVASVRGKQVAFVRHPAALDEECARADIVISRLPVGRSCSKTRVTVDVIDILEQGAHALYLEGQSVRITTVAEQRGSRPWSHTRRKIRKADPSAPGDSNAYASEAGPGNRQKTEN
ncbi:MAG: ComEC family competence protein [Hyphomicrobiaceae bacterium]|nr:ComEC family competence protein [Hyphomicrobiaceae bacterium]